MKNPAAEVTRDGAESISNCEQTTSETPAVNPTDSTP